MKTQNKLNSLNSVSTLTNGQKAKLFYLFQKLALATHKTDLKLHRQSDYKGGFDSKIHAAKLTANLHKRVTHYFSERLTAAEITYPSMVAALTDHIKSVDRQRYQFNSVVRAGISWEMYVKADQNEITNSKGQSITHFLKCYLWAANAKCDLDDLDAAVGTGRYSQFSNKPKLPQAVRKAVKRQKGHFNYTIENFGDYLGLLEGTATAKGCYTNGLDIDSWADFSDTSAQEFKYYPGLHIQT